MKHSVTFLCREDHYWSGDAEDESGAILQAAEAVFYVWPRRRIFEELPVFKYDHFLSRFPGPRKITLNVIVHGLLAQMHLYPVLPPGP